MLVRRNTACFRVEDSLRVQQLKVSAMKGVEHVKNHRTRSVRRQQG